MRVVNIRQSTNNTGYTATLIKFSHLNIITTNVIPFIMADLTTYHSPSSGFLFTRVLAYRSCVDIGEYLLDLRHQPAFPPTQDIPIRYLHAYHVSHLLALCVEAPEYALDDPA